MANTEIERIKSSLALLFPSNSGFTITDHIAGNNAIIDAVIDFIQPLGQPLPYVGSVAPAGYFIADGTLRINRNTHPRLFSLWENILQKYDDDNLQSPDLRGRTLIGAGLLNQLNCANLSDPTITWNSNVNYILGTVGGYQTYKQAAAEVGKHQHNLLVTSNGSQNGVGVFPPGRTDNPDQWRDYYHTELNSNSGEPMYNMQPYFVCNYIFRLG